MIVKIKTDYYFEGIQEKFNEFIDFCEKCDFISIYGAGAMAAMASRFFKNNNIHWNKFYVTEANGRLEMMGHEICEIGTIDYSEGLILAVNKKNSVEIIKFLEEKYPNCKFYYDEEFMSLVYLDERLSIMGDVTEENNYLLKIMDYNFDRDVFYICCPCSIGDTLYVCALIKELKKIINKKICVVVKENHSSIPDLFEYIDLKIVSNDLVKALEVYSVSRKKWKLNNYLYGYFKKNIFEQLEEEYYEYNCQSVIEKYNRLVLSIPESTKPYRPVTKTDWKQKKIWRSAIILMPYAQTVNEIEMEFWESLADELRGKYDIYTNVKDNTEKEIRGTSRLSESILDTLKICMECTVTISIRNGMCDVLGLAGAPLIVIDREETGKEWSINNLKTDNKLNNVIYRKNYTEDMLLEEVLKFMPNYIH